MCECEGRACVAAMVVECPHRLFLLPASDSRVYSDEVDEQIDEVEVERERVLQVIGCRRNAGPATVLADRALRVDRRQHREHADREADIIVRMRSAHKQS
jgi:hypothetical protein